MKLVYLITLGAPLLFSAQMLAHVGHEDEEPKLNAVLSADQTVTQEVTTETVELVLKHTVFEPGKAVNARVFLSTADENIPIANANIEFEFPEANGLKIKFAPEKDHPGIYFAAMRFPTSGAFDATISVSSAKINDLLTLQGIAVKSPQAATTSSGFPYLYVGAGFAALVICALIVILLIRRRKHV
jgi:hypothetical protein